MYRTPTHESRYKQGKRDRESREVDGKYEEPREYSEGSSTEEDEESTDRYTEESEDTTESQRREGMEGRSSTGGTHFERERGFARFSRPEDFLMGAYYANEKIKKHDKNTQKNFLSPFPSFLIPPIYRDISGQPNFRYNSPNTAREDKELLVSYGRSSRNSPKDSYEEQKVHSSNRDRRDKRLCEKHRCNREGKHFSLKSCKPQRILTCLQKENSLDPRSSFTKNVQNPESAKTTTESRRKQKSASREDKVNQLPNACKNCLQGKDNQNKDAVERSSQAADTVRGFTQTGKTPNGRPENIVPGKVREKLVYVVEEEEGKKVTKLETDLFSVNEILAIKKDLLELSEFAKKLKKLKEMKKDAENEKANKSSCQCKPVTELLKDVNKRIEALEARQEELERGNRKSGLKFDTEIESNRMTERNTPQALPMTPPKTPVVRHESAVTVALSFPKTEMLLSKDGFSNNCEIAHELMDIKNQLQKLEKRRMSETTPEAEPLGKSKPANKKNLGISVFSSKTYILTSDKYKKKVNGATVKEEEKAKNYLSNVEKPKSKTEQIQENVANWLKNMTPVEERSENDFATFLNVGAQELKVDSHLVKCAHSPRVFKNNCFANKEPQKNRASGLESVNKVGVDLEVLMKNNKKINSSAREQGSHLNCKKCVLTTSGQLFLLDSHEKLPKQKAVHPSQPKGQTEEFDRSFSNESISSAVLNKKKYVDGQKATNGPKEVHGSSMLIPSPFESTQELSTTSSGHKDQKTERNINLKKLTSIPAGEKIHKDHKNDFVKRLETNLMELKNFERDEGRRSSSSYSQLLGAVDLDTEKTSDSLDRQESAGLNMNVYSLGKMPQLNFKSLEPNDSRNRFWKKPNKRKKAAEEAIKENLRVIQNMQNQKPDCIKEPSTSKQAKCEEPKAERRYYKCESCLMKKLKTGPSEGKVSVVETASLISNASGKDFESKHCKKYKDKEERIEEKMKKMKARAQEQQERRKEKQRRAECREIEKKRRSKERAEKKICKEFTKKKRSRERFNRRVRDCVKIKRSQERLKRRKSKESCRSKRKLSKHTLDRRESKCQTPRRPPRCHPECRPSRSCLKQTDQIPLEESKSLESVCSETQSENTGERYSRRQELEPQIEKEKLADDSCKFGSFFKSLRRLYPKFSHLQFGNFSGDTNDRKSLQQQPKKSVECLKNNHYYSYNNDESFCCSGKSLHGHSSHSLRNAQHHSHHPHQHNLSSHHGHNQQINSAAKSEYLKNCKCIRVYLQSQQHQKWPGILPFRSLSRENAGEILRTDSTESFKTIKRDFIFPGRLPDSQCVGHYFEKKCPKKCERKCRKCKTKTKRHRRRHCKCRRKSHRRKRCHSEEDLCVCGKCGNVHEKDETQSGNQCACDGEMPADRCKPADQVHFPIFSFLRYFCKHKPQVSKKSGYTILKKLSEVPRLRTCARRKHDKKMKKSSWQCVPVRTDLPSEGSTCRKKEKKIHDCCVETEPCSCAKKKRRRRKKCRECSNSENRDKCCKERRKRRKRKKKRCCECPENVLCPRSTNPAEYCVRPALFKNTETTTVNDAKEFSEVNGSNSTNRTSEINGTNETSETATTKATATTTTATTTTTTTTMTATTVEEEKSLTILKLENDLRKKNWKLKERLSSIQFLLKNLQRLKKAKRHAETSNFISADPDQIDECSKCSPKMVQDLKMKSSSFMNKIKKFKGVNSRKNKREEKSAESM